MRAADRSELTPIDHAVQRGDYQMAKMFFEFSNIQENPVSEWLSKPGKTKLTWQDKSNLAGLGIWGVRHSPITEYRKYRH